MARDYTCALTFILGCLFCFSALSLTIHYTNTHCDILGNSSCPEEIKKTCRDLSPALKISNELVTIECSWARATFIIGLGSLSLAINFLVIVLLIIKGIVFKLLLKVLLRISVIGLLITIGLMIGDIIKGYGQYKKSESQYSYSPLNYIMNIALIYLTILLILYLNSVGKSKIEQKEAILKHLNTNTNLNRVQLSQNSESSFVLDSFSKLGEDTKTLYTNEFGMDANHFPPRMPHQRAPRRLPSTRFQFSSPKERILTAREPETNYLQ